MNNIILEGPDGIGKTTIANQLRADNDNLSYCHLSSQTPNTYEYHMQLLNESNVIYDRFNLGEHVYSDVFNRKCKMSMTEFKSILDKIQSTNSHMFILVTDDIDFLKQRLSVRGEDTATFNKINEINEKFKSISILTKEYNNIHLIAVNKNNENEVYNKIKEIVYE